MRPLIAALLITLLTGASVAQSTTPLSKQQETIRRKARSLTANAPISVIPLNAAEEFGNYINSDDNQISFYDVDRKTNVSLHYSELRKLKNGYGGYNSVQRRHTDRDRALVVILLTVGVLAGVIAAAAAAK